MREEIAELAHEQWSRWTEWMLDRRTPDNMARWKRQINTPYAELSEKEKDSDRIEADKILALPLPPVELECGECWGYGEFGDYGELKTEICLTCKGTGVRRWRFVVDKECPEQKPNCILSCDKECKSVKPNLRQDIGETLIGIITRPATVADKLNYKNDFGFADINEWISLMMKHGYKNTGKHRLPSGEVLRVEEVKG
jgi:hypothetical protein